MSRVVWETRPLRNQDRGQLPATLRSDGKWHLRQGQAPATCGWASSADRVGHGSRHTPLPGYGPSADRWGWDRCPRTPSRHDTGQVPVASLDDVRAALRDEEPVELLGLAECGWLDAKAGVYRLDDPAKAAELVKDVAAFANTRTGGVLVVGISTRTEHGMEILDEIRPVPRDLVDLDRHRKLVRGIIPPPRGVTVGWIACGQDRGVLFIDVPAQPPACLPHVVLGPERAGRASSRSVAVPVREGDSTQPFGDPAPAGRRMGGDRWPPRGGLAWLDRKDGCGGPAGPATHSARLPGRRGRAILGPAVPRGAHRSGRTGGHPGRAGLPRGTRCGPAFRRP